MMPNPLIGENIDELGPRFPDMSEAYDPDLIRHVLKIANTNQIKVHIGVYVGVTGPCYETPAEYKYFRIIGGDAVGMSTVPEVIVARHMNIRCFGLSVITDLGIPEKMEYITHEMVQRVAGEAEPRAAVLIRELTGKIRDVS
jgi:purine-nucleoside phosphorylase